MTLKTRIIPTLLTDGSQCVKPVAFQRPYRKLGPMLQYVKVMERRNIDEIIILDIEATAKGRKPNFDKIKEYCSLLFCPVTYGGGISEIDDITRLITECGVDKVAIKTHNEIIGHAALRFGSQAIVGVLDDDPDNTIHYLAAKNIENLGAGEILVTSQHREGQMKGYDLDLIHQVASRAKIPIIANGGCGHPHNMLEAIEEGASAVAAGSMFLYTDWTPRKCAEYLKENGVETRVDNVPNNPT